MTLDETDQLKAELLLLGFEIEGNWDSEYSEPLWLMERNQLCANQGLIVMHVEAFQSTRWADKSVSIKWGTVKYYDEIEDVLNTINETEHCYKWKRFASAKILQVIREIFTMKGENNEGSVHRQTG